MGTSALRSANSLEVQLAGRSFKTRRSFYNVYDQQEERQAFIIRFNATAGLPADLLAQQGVYQTTNDVKTYLIKTRS